MDFFTLQRLREQEEQQAQSEQTEQTEQTQRPPMHETKLVNTEIHNNYGTVISGGTNTIYLLDKDGKIDIANMEEMQSASVAPVAHVNPQPHYPRENDYIGLIQWLKEQSIDWRTQYGGNRSKAAEKLSPSVGWTIDSRTWARAENRQL